MTTYNQEQEALAKGKENYYADYELTDNPYQVASKEYYIWKHGFFQARNEANPHEPVVKLTPIVAEDLVIFISQLEPEDGEEWSDQTVMSIATSVAVYLQDIEFDKDK